MKRAATRKPALGALCAWTMVVGIVISGFGTARADALPEILRSAVPAPELTAKTWVLIDYNSGWVLAENNADTPIEPASLSKLMTAYVVFHELRKGSLKLSDLAHVSEKAWRTEGSRMFIRVNTKVAVEDLLKGLIIQSGNDAAVALAEHVAGTEAGFAELMNQYARQLKLENTHFTNAPGLPDPEHYSSARDISLIAAAIVREFPEFYNWYSTKEFTYNEITQQNRNLLLWRDEAVDGVKTGHTSSAGYCLVGSAKRDGMRLIATVTGTSSPAHRAREVHALLKYGFASYESKQVFESEQPTDQIKVFKGSSDRLLLGSSHQVYVTVPRGNAESLKAVISRPPYAVAPISAGRPLGTAQINYGDHPLMEVPLVALTEITEGSWWQRAIDAVLLWFE